MTVRSAVRIACSGTLLAILLVATVGAFVPCDHDAGTDTTCIVHLWTHAPKAAPGAPAVAPRPVHRLVTFAFAETSQPAALPRAATPAARAPPTR